jgi:hemoglobin-like flavoprotein
MNKQQIKHVQDSWQAVLPIANVAARLFYDKLFEIDPDIKPMFKGDMKAQGDALVKMINVAVASLDRLDTIKPALRSLGERHVGYGVQTRHYQTVATALLWTLKQGLDERFTDSVEQAWIEAYTVLSSTMIEGATTAVERGKPVSTGRPQTIVDRVAGWLARWRPMEQG